MGEALENWYRIARLASWGSLVDVRKVFPATDAVGDFTVFNIKGNSYRLITQIYYSNDTILVRKILTHAEYDKERWSK